FDHAIRAYNEFLASRPNDVGALVNVGISLASTGRSGDAIAAFRRGIAVDPKNVTPRRNLVNALLNGRQLHAAAEESRALLRIRPPHAVGHDLLGRALAEQGKFEDAQKEFELAVQLD